MFEVFKNCFLTKDEHKDENKTIFFKRNKKKPLIFFFFFSIIYKNIHTKKIQHTKVHCFYCCSLLIGVFRWLQLVRKGEGNEIQIIDWLPLVVCRSLLWRKDERLIEVSGVLYNLEFIHLQCYTFRSIQYW